MKRISMKRISVRFSLLLLVGLGAGLTMAWPALMEERQQSAQQARRRALYSDPPQSERALRVPSEAQLAREFPGDSRRVLEGSAELVLFSVEPVKDWDRSGPSFHEHQILGQTVIRDVAGKKALLASLYDGLVPPPTGLRQVRFGCFNPRHGIRATRGKKVVDLLICFSCQQFYVYEGVGAKSEMVAHSDIMFHPRPTFDAILKAAGVPVSQ